MTSAAAGPTTGTPAISPFRRLVLIPTPTKQCCGFMIGSALFAAGSAPWLGIWMGAANANICYFLGAWFFTGAALIQLLTSGAVTVPVEYAPGQMLRAQWLAASTQFFGTLLFNVSTTAALTAHTTSADDHLVWKPDAGGSVAFLISGIFVLVDYFHGHRRWNPTDAGWWSGLINLLGCIAFGVSAVGAYVMPDGASVDNMLANTCTFIGAVCFFVSSLIVLPQWRSAGR
ncbi:hypothetical protein ACPXB3_07380 [Gordonia sp. DT219]|uniref:hypothetical protein n=1 Tax=Gordonia sp. DT219 TaxID=3416658 RepID=UPI003CEE5E07